MKRLLAALVAAATVAAPVSARIDDGTPELLRTVDQYVNVHVDPPRCSSGEYAGSWQPSTDTLTLCTHGSIDADDHDNVRHEVWHIIQTCITPPRAKYLQPVIDNSNYWKTMVVDNLTASELQWIIDTYPTAHVPPEMEAFVIAEQLTASQVRDMFIRACT